MSCHRAIIRLSAVLAVVALTKGCGDGENPAAPPTPEPARPTTVTVSPATRELTALGTTVQLSAEVRDQNARVMAGATVTWTSSANSVATVDASGLVTAAGNGTATITASVGSASGSAVVTVMQSVASVEVSPSVDQLTALGQTVQLTAEAFDENGHAVAGAEFSWESSDAAVATVDAGGLVTAVAEGVATITASAGEASGSAVVTVMQPVASVEVSPSVETIGLGSTLQLTAEAFDENGHAVAGVEFAWESSDRAVATVDGSGLATAIAEGTATITATAGDARGTAEIAVENPDRAALVALYEATGGPNWVNSENWLTDAPLGDWYGVITDGQGRVFALELSENGLTGPIPPELGKLANLTSLQLSDNDDLTGPIPPELGNLTSLEYLWLALTALSGPIPKELANLSNLKVLQLPGGVCVPADLRAWAVERGFSLFPCSSEGRLLPAALMREDGNGLSLALPDDLREPSAVTVSDPSVVAVSVADGWLELVPRGRGSAEVELVPSGGGAPASARVVVRAAVGTFGIDIVMDRPGTVTYEKALTTGADWWSSALDGTEWPDRRPTCFSDRATGLADELLIHARIDRDAQGAIAYAETCFRHSGEQAALDPGGGRVSFRPSVVGNSLTVIHEIGHLLGLVLWGPETGLTTEDRAYFVGPQAVKAFRARGGDPGLPGVPIDGSHFARGVNDGLMAGAGDGAISLGALADAGYTVVMKALPPPGRASGGRSRERRCPRRAVRPTGWARRNWPAALNVPLRHDLGHADRGGGGSWRTGKPLWMVALTKAYRRREGPDLRGREHGCQGSTVVHRCWRGWGSAERRSWRWVNGDLPGTAQTGDAGRSAGSRRELSLGWRRVPARTRTPYAREGQRRSRGTVTLLFTGCYNRYAVNALDNVRDWSAKISLASASDREPGTDYGAERAVAL